MQQIYETSLNHALTSQSKKITVKTIQQPNKNFRNFDKKVLLIQKMEEHKLVPSFLLKTFQILESPNDAIQWNKEGTAFAILDIDKLSEEILPHYFKHKNYHSFLRQLNMYGFKKSKDAIGAQFSHRYFRRGCSGNLEKIKRRSQEDIDKTYQSLTKDFMTESYLLEHNQLRETLRSMQAKQQEIMVQFHDAMERNITLKKETTTLYQKLQCMRNYQLRKWTTLKTIINRLPDDAKNGKLAKRKMEIRRRFEEIEYPEIMNHLTEPDSFASGRSPVPILYANARAHML